MASIDLSVPLNFDEILHAVGGRTEWQGPEKIHTVVTHTDECRENVLFLSLARDSREKKEHVEIAEKRGAIPLCDHVSARGIMVKDTRQALLELSGYYKKKLPALKHTLAITGSTGKTTTKNICRILLSEGFVTHATEGNQNNELGLPYTILSAPRDCEVLVLEMGMNHPGEIEALSRCAQPDVALITNIGTAHIGELGSIEWIAKAKCEVLAGMKQGTVIFPQNEPLLSHLAELAKSYTVGSEPPANLYTVAREQDASGSFGILYRTDRPPLPVHLCVPGQGEWQALCFACAAATVLGLSDESIRRGILNISKDIARQKIYTHHGIQIIEDLYNASYESMENAIDLLLLHPGRKTALLGDMLELGMQTAPLHRRVGHYAAKCGVRELYLFGCYAPFVAEGAADGGLAKERIFMHTNIANPAGMAEILKERCKRGDVLLCKASRGMHLERVLAIFKES